MYDRLRPYVGKALLSLLAVATACSPAAATRTPEVKPQILPKDVSCFTIFYGFGQGYLGYLSYSLGRLVSDNRSAIWYDIYPIRDSKDIDSGRPHTQTNNVNFWHSDETNPFAPPALSGNVTVRLTPTGEFDENGVRVTDCQVIEVSPVR